MKRIVMGLDISTSTIGIALLELDKKIPKLIHYEYYKPNKKLDQLVWLSNAKKHVTALIDGYGVTEVAVEEYVKFMKGKSNASTVIPLAILNTVVRMDIWESTDERIKPRVMNVLKIRHAIKKDKKLPPKEDVPELVASILGIEFPWDYKINRRTKKKEKRVENWDVADAIAVALAHIARPEK
jgi:Holliday junction resolvasome RuvABC endonuclease subunit